MARFPAGKELISAKLLYYSLCNFLIKKTKTYNKEIPIVINFKYIK
jgi:hypothetical protein